MNYINVLYEALQEVLPPLLLLPEEALGQLFRTAVGYLANEPETEPLPPALWAAWEMLQTRLDRIVDGTVSPRAALHLTASRRAWFLRALADEDAGRLASRFVRVLLGERPELPAPLHAREVQLQMHFAQTAESLSRSVPDRIVRGFAKVHTALMTVQQADPMEEEEFNYLAGCLLLLELEKSGETANGMPVVQDAVQLARLQAAQWLLTGGTPETLDMRSHLQAAEAYLNPAPQQMQSAPPQDIAAAQPQAPPEPQAAEPPSPSVKTPPEAASTPWTGVPTSAGSLWSTNAESDWE